MIRQYDAQKKTEELLKKFTTFSHDNRIEGNDYKSLYDQGWRVNFTKASAWLARCYHDEKRIVYSLQFLTSTSQVDFDNTALHEIAHALCGPGVGHTDIWVEKAKSIGLANPTPCGDMNIAAGRAIAPPEIKPKRTFNRVDILCPKCGKKAIERSSMTANGTRWIMLECNHLVKHESIASNQQDYSSWTSASGKTIFPFQVEGIKFLEDSGGRALIADEPGLGKTIQALGFAYFHKEEVCPVLWVCKTTLKLQALKEAIDWCGPGFMGQIIENGRSFILPNLKLYIISMDLLRNMPTEKLEKIGFKTVIADEIQHFKNPDSARTAELRKLVTQAEYFVPLSGTPWKNRGEEYFSVLNMLDPARFPSQENFKNRWVDFRFDEKRQKYIQGGIKDIPAFRTFTKDIVIRRLRDEVLPDLPKINRQIRFVDMEELYKKAYDKSEEKVAFFIRAAMIDGKPMQSIASEIMKLKHITGLAKVQVCIEDVQEFIEQTEEAQKITIFHHHIDVGNNLQEGDGQTYKGLDEYLVSQGLNKSLRLYGGKSPTERDDVIGRFKSDSKNRVLIASTLASGEGLNIQFCQNAMLLERQWNPANEEQAELRFSRPLTKLDLPQYLQDYMFNPDGTQKPVSIRIPYFIADGTIDSMLTEIIERKRIAFRKTMNDKDANITWQENEIMTELAELIIRKRLGKV